jgi:hypothetical protein
MVKSKAKFSITFQDLNEAANKLPYIKDMEKSYNYLKERDNIQNDSSFKEYIELYETDEECLECCANRMDWATQCLKEAATQQYCDFGLTGSILMYLAAIGELPEQAVKDGEILVEVSW